MNKEELIGKLQMVYVGDTNALNELIGYYDGLKQGIDELQQENKKYKEVFDKAKTKLEQGITFCQNDSQGLYDICNIAIHREQSILDILKEVE